MDNAIYIALSKQAAQFRQMAVISNNLANMNTTGFNRELMVFDDYLVPDAARRKSAFANDIATWRDTKQGSLVTTGNVLDMAIEGDSYFVVDTPQGERYTKAGNFQINPDGILVTQEGYTVQGEGGAPIQFQEEDNNIEVIEEGFILADGEERGQLRLVQFPDSQLLERAGSNLYSSTVPAQVAENTRVLQGVYEGSNVEPVSEITNMIMTSRRVGSTSEMIEGVYDMQRKLIGVLAKVQ